MVCCISFLASVQHGCFLTHGLLSITDTDKQILFIAMQSWHSTTSYVFVAASVLKRTLTRLTESLRRTHFRHFEARVKRLCIVGRVTRCHVGVLVRRNGVIGVCIVVLAVVVLIPFEMRTALVLVVLDLQQLVDVLDPRKLYKSLICSRWGNSYVLRQF